MPTNFSTSCGTDHQVHPPEKLPEEQVLGQYIPLLYHYNMLQDEDRVRAFSEAIDLTVHSGMHVVELGGGTGILSSFAARRGAKVTCVEQNPELVSCARKFLRLNGLQDQVRVIHADATKFVPEVPVDVVVCEMLHVGLLREKQAQVISAFKRNYTRVHGDRLPNFLPEVSILMAQPVHQSFEFFGYTAAVPLFQAPILEQPRTTQLADLQPYANIAYDEQIPFDFHVRQRVVIRHAGKINAIRFVTQNVLTVDLKGQRAITWPNQCLVLPLESQLDVADNQTVEISFKYACGGSIDRLQDSIRCDLHDSAKQVSPRQTITRSTIAQA
jgi:predicted RNA methylase